MEKEADMRILISGALGHIGSKLIHNICPGEFDEVRMIDNLSSQRYASLFNLTKGVNFKFIEDDIHLLSLALESDSLILYLYSQPGLLKKIHSYEDFQYTLRVGSGLMSPIRKFLTSKRAHINMLWDKFNEKDAFSRARLYKTPEEEAQVKSSAPVI